MADYDLIILGAGPAGLTAALYAGRSRLKVAVLERGIPGGQAATTDRIENYPGFPGGIGGLQLARRMEEHAREFGAEFICSEATGLKRHQGKKGCFSVTQTGTTDEMTARSVIIATGTKERSLQIPGEREFRGRGVSYCATCDGAFFEGGTVAVVGGGDSAVEEGLYLTRYAKKVFIIHRRSELRANKTLQERAMQNAKIEFIWNSVVSAIEGNQEGFIRQIRVNDVQSGRTSAIMVDGVFIYVGRIPNTGFIRDFIALDDKGYIIAGEDLETSVEGVFAAGDVRTKRLRQISTAVGDGALAAMNVVKYLGDNFRH